MKSGTHIESGEEVAIKMIDRSKYGPNDGTLEREIQVLEKVIFLLESALATQKLYFHIRVCSV